MSKKRDRTMVTSHAEQSSGDTVRKAKVTVLGLLDNCLGRYNLDVTSKNDFLNEIATLLKVKSDDGKPYKITTSKSSIEKDEHNEICEVCETGGDLLCCETCTLVFHISCLRPKITSIPKENWSCPHCIADGTVTGDILMAQDSVDKMKRLSQRILQKRLLENTTNSLGKQEETPILIKPKLSIGKVGKFYTILNTDQHELGRFSSIESVFAYVKKVMKTKCYPTNKINTSSIDIKKEEDSFWCIHCIDDSNITICAYCGCQTCFGKLDSKHLLICDGCEQEYHTYCLTPPLIEIPKTAWYCPKCDFLRYQQRVKLTCTSLETSIDKENMSILETDHMKLMHTDNIMVSGVVHRGRGRPAGRKNKESMIQSNSISNISSTSMNNSYNNLIQSSDGDLSSSNAVHHSQGQQNNEYDNNSISIVINVEVALDFIRNLKDCNLTRKEKYILAQIRKWSPIYDVQIIHQALKSKYEELTQSAETHKADTTTTTTATDL